jgi:hypothetical protein
MYMYIYIHIYIHIHICCEYLFHVTQLPRKKYFACVKSVDCVCTSCRLSTCSIQYSMYACKYIHMRIHTYM